MWSYAKKNADEKAVQILPINLQLIHSFIDSFCSHDFLKKFQIEMTQVVFLL